MRGRPAGGYRPADGSMSIGSSCDWHGRFHVVVLVHVVVHDNGGIEARSERWLDADEGGVDQRAHPDHAGEGLTEAPHLFHGDDDGDADHGGQVHHAEGNEHQHQGPAATEAEQAVLDAGSQVTQTAFEGACSATGGPAASGSG